MKNQPYAVTIYTQPNCPACTAAKRHMDKLGITYTERSAIEHVAMLRAEGHQQAPVTTAALPGYTETWSGYDPSRIKALAEIGKTA